MPGPVFREGETVELRTVEPEDADFLRRTVNDPRVRAGLAAVRPVNGPAEDEWIENLGEDDGDAFLVCVDGDPVGEVSIDPVGHTWGTAEIGYMVAPAEWGNGYATDAVREVCGYAFEERRFAKVFAHTYATNPASARVLEKVGFEREGVLREEAFVDGERVDLHRHGILAREFLAESGATGED